VAGAVKVDPKAVLTGAGVAAVVAAVTVALAQAVSSLTDFDANLPLYFVLLGGLANGGFVAARLQPRSPLTHGALAAIAGLLAVIVASVVIRLAFGREQADPVSLVFHLFMASSAGILGGYLSARHPRPET
jgi:putative membrane protein (TIGR04086 family)